MGNGEVLASSDGSDCSVSDALKCSGMNMFAPGRFCVGCCMSLYLRPVVTLPCKHVLHTEVWAWCNVYCSVALSWLDSTLDSVVPLVMIILHLLHLSLGKTAHAILSYNYLHLQYKCTRVHYSSIPLGQYCTQI